MTLEQLKIIIDKLPLSINDYIITTEDFCKGFDGEISINNINKIINIE